MTSHKQANTELRESNRISSEGLAFCKGLSRSNAEYVYGELEGLLAASDRDEAQVMRVFMNNFAHALKSTNDYRS